MGQSQSRTGSFSLEEVIEGIRARLRNGERPRLEEYVAEHPEMAEELRGIWPALVLMEDLAGSRLGGTGGFTVEPGYTTSTVPPPVLGDYRLLRPIGRGGMGVVYEAEQVSLGRRVALKVLPQHLTGDEKRLQRFEREARAAGKLHHTNIVPVFGVGHHEGTHFYIMPLIRGLGLDSVIEELRRLRALGEKPLEGGRGINGSDGAEDGRGVSQLARTLLMGPSVPVVETNDGEEATEAGFPDRLESDGLGRTEAVVSPSELSSLSREGSRYWESVARVGLQAAEALEYAHEQGILHRDIKPSNLLLDLKGTVWVTDFGLAKAVDDEASLSHEVVGTIRYMAPERFSGEADARSDVYSLGLTLYELLALRPAFVARGHQQLVREVTQGTPPPLGRLDANIPRDLVTIVEKAIEREPGRRYGSAGALAEDLRRYLAGRPIAARRTKAVERFGMWCRRNPALAASNITAAVLTTTVAVISTISSLRLSQTSGELEKSLRSQTQATRQAVAEAERAERAEKVALAREYEALISEARASRFSGRPGQRFETMRAIEGALGLLPRLGMEREEERQQRAELRDLAISSFALVDINTRTWVKLAGITSDRHHVAFSGDRSRRARIDMKTGELVVTRSSDEAVIDRLPSGGYERKLPRFSPDGEMLAFHDLHPEGWRVGVWRIGAADFARVGTRLRPSEMAFSPDGKRIAVGCPDEARLSMADTGTAEVVASWPIYRGPWGACALAFSPDGEKLAVVSGGYPSDESKVVRIYEVSTGRVLERLETGDRVRSLAWDPRGDVLAAGHWDGGALSMWELRATGARRLAPLNEQREASVMVGYNGTGDMLACVSNWGMGGLTVYEPATGRQLLHVAGYSEDNTLWPRLSPTADGGLVSLRGGGEPIVETEIVPGLAYRTLTRRTRKRESGLESYQSVAVHPGGRLAAGGSERLTVFWDLATGRQVGEIQGTGAGAEVWFEPDGGGFWVCGQVTGIVRWPVSEAEGEVRIGPPTRWHFRGSEYATVRTSGDGKVIAFPVAFDRGVRVIDRDRSEQIEVLEAGADVRKLDVSRDGRHVLTQRHTERELKLWETGSGRLVGTFPGVAGEESRGDVAGVWPEPGTGSPRVTIEAVRAMRSHNAYAHQVSMIFDQTLPGRIRARDVESGRVVMNLDAPIEEAYRSIAVSPDGSWVVAAGSAAPAGVRCWDMRAVMRELRAAGLAEGLGVYGAEAGGSGAVEPLRLRILREPFEDPGYEHTWRVKEAERRLRTDPENWLWHFDRGIALANLYRYGEARESLTRAIALKPGVSWTLLARARVLRMLGDEAGAGVDEVAARPLLEAKRSESEELTAAFNDLAWQLVSERGAKASAVYWGVTLAEQAVRFELNVAQRRSRWNTLGVAYYRARRYAEAEQAFEEALAHGRVGNAYDHYYLAMVKHRLGDGSGARAEQAEGEGWVRAHWAELGVQQRNAIEALEAEVECVLSGPAGELPAEVFARE